MWLINTKSNKIKENSNTVRHLNNGTDHRHSKSCCDQSSPARRTTIEVKNKVILPLPRLKKSEKCGIQDICWSIGSLWHQVINSWMYNRRDFVFCGEYFDGLLQERRNSIANALELHLSCTDPSIYDRKVMFPQINSTRQISNKWKQCVRTHEFSLVTPVKAIMVVFAHSPHQVMALLRGNLVATVCNTPLFIIFYFFISFIQSFFFFFHIYLLSELMGNPAIFCSNSKLILLASMPLTMNGSFC